MKEHAKSLEAKNRVSEGGDSIVSRSNLEMNRSLIIEPRAGSLLLLIASIAFKASSNDI